MNRRERLEREIKRLQAKLDACFEKRLDTDDPVKEVTLEGLENALEEKIERKQRELNELIDTPASQNLKALDLEKGLRSIDFVQAKELIQTLVDQLRANQGGLAFLLMERCIDMEGELLLQSVRTILDSGSGELLPVPIGFSPIVPADELAFLRLLGDYFGLSLEQSNADRAQTLSHASDAVIAEIAGMLRSGTTVLISLKNWDKIGIDSQSSFLDWLVNVFWKRLVDAVKKVMEDYSPKLFFIVVVDEELSEQCLESGHFCESAEVTVPKIVRMPLSYWTQKDIRLWLDSYSVTLKKRQRDELLRNIFGKSDEMEPFRVRKKLEYAHARSDF